ncbi:MAG: hypothetical protein IJ971_05940 [Bacteroidales bacterium]|nr:hypothetical protein [Bacteroidales bacterium]
MSPQKPSVVSEIREYMDLRLDDIKLKAVDGLAVGVSRVLSLMVVLMLGAIVLAAFAFGTVLLLGDLIGSWAAAAFIIGGVFLIALVAVLLVWKKLFVNIFVKLFIDIFYEKE